MNFYNFLDDEQVFAEGLERCLTLTKMSYSLAYDIWVLCTFLDRECIPEEFFVLGASELGPPFAGEYAEVVDRVDQAIRHLTKFGFVGRTSDFGLLSIHRWAPKYIKATMDTEEQRMWTERVIKALYKIFTDVDASPAYTLALCKRFLPHVLFSMESIEKGWVDIPEMIGLLLRTGWYLQNHEVDDQNAEQLHCLAFKVATRLYPD